MRRAIIWTMWAGIAIVLYAAVAHESAWAPADEPAAAPGADTGSAANLTANRPPADSKESAAAQDPLVAEILEIRNRQGSLLSGSLLERVSEAGAADDCPDGEFAAALSRIVERSDQQPTPAVDSPSAGERFPPQYERADLTGDQQLVAVLQSESRALDAKSHDLEALRQYERADELRRLARRLRRQARLLDPGRF